MKNIINNEQDTREYIKNILLQIKTKPKNAMQ